MNYDERLYIQASKPTDELQRQRIRLRMTMHIRRSEKKLERKRQRNGERGMVSKGNKQGIEEERNEKKKIPQVQ
jgi:hypothetical protein